MNVTSGKVSAGISLLGVIVSAVAVGLAWLSARSARCAAEESNEAARRSAEASEQAAAIADRDLRMGALSEYGCFKLDDSWVYPTTEPGRLVIDLLLRNIGGGPAALGRIKWEGEKPSAARVWPVYHDLVDVRIEERGGAPGCSQANRCR